MTTCRWEYRITTAADAAKHAADAEHRIWSAQWVQGLPEEAESETAFVVVATRVAAAGAPPVAPPPGPAIGSAELRGDKDPVPPPPPPPPPRALADFIDATALWLAPAPRDFTE